MTAPKMIFIDFDRTMFNTWQFADELTLIFRKYGEVEPHVTSLYQEGENYNIIKHLDLVRTQAMKKRVKQQLRVFFDNLGNFIFDDALKFIQLLSADNDNDLALLSKGERNFQSKKIYLALGHQTRLFKNILIIENAKATEIKRFQQIGSSRKIFFIDDKTAELEAANKVAPGITTIHIDRGDLPDRGLSKNYRPDFIVTDLLEAFYIIKSTCDS